MQINSSLFPQGSFGRTEEVRTGCYTPSVTGTGGLIAKGGSSFSFGLLQY